LMICALVGIHRDRLALCMQHCRAELSPVKESNSIL